MFPQWLNHAALAVISADAPVLALLVDLGVITPPIAVDIGAVIAGLTVGWQGHRAVAIAKAKSGAS